MSTSLSDRLNQILPRVTSNDFLSSEGIGNDIACHIFDYPAKDELTVREHIEMMMRRFASHHSELRVLHLNLLDVVVKYLKKRGLYDRAVEMQRTKDGASLIRALKGPLSAEKLRDFIAAENDLANEDLLLVSGVGSVWPLLRAHTLLNCMHTVMWKTPLVMFYPGSFDGKTLRLFGRIEKASSKPGKDSYYRAFILVPGGNEE